MHTELVRIYTDTVPLDGAFYRPDGGPGHPGPVPGHTGVLLMHGNVGNFYSGPPRFLPEQLTAAGFTCLAFNRRGHDILTNHSERGADGGAFQTASEGLADNECAAAFLAARGYPAPVVIGHSNGGVLAACFAARHPEVQALVLLSAHAGGAGAYRRDSAAGLMAIDETDAHEAKARCLVSQGRGDSLMLLPGWWYVTSAASLLDRIENTPDLLAQAGAVACPTLAIRGSLEPQASYPMEEFAARAAGHAEALVLEGCDHFYTGYEALVAQTVAKWLDAWCRPGD